MVERVGERHSGTGEEIGMVERRRQAWWSGEDKHGGMGETGMVDWGHRHSGMGRQAMVERR